MRETRISPGAAMLAEMARLARPGGWVASQEPDCEHSLCYPPLPAWDRLQEIFWASFRRSGAAWGRKPAAGGGPS